MWNQDSGNTIEHQTKRTRLRQTQQPNTLRKGTIERNTASKLKTKPIETTGGLIGVRAREGGIVEFDAEKGIRDRDWVVGDGELWVEKNDSTAWAQKA